MAYTEDDIPAALMARSRFMLGRNIDGEIQEGDDVGDSLPAAQMVAVDGEGAVYVTPIPGASFPVEIADVVNTNETLYSSWETFDEQVMATGSLTTGEQLTAHAATGGFMVIANPSNSGTVYLGSAADKCFIPLPQGTPYSVSLNNTNKAYFRAVEDGDGVFVIVYTL